MKGYYLKTIPEILKNNANIIFPTKLSLKIAKFNKEAEDNISMYRMVLDKLINEYVEKDENNKPLIKEDGTATLKDDCIEKWNKEYNVLENSEFEFKTKFTMDDLDLMKLTPVQASTMLNLIED